MKPVLSDRDVSSTFARGMAVLRAFDDSHARLTLAEISRITALDRASVRRLVLTLVQLGYARKDARYFSLTPKVLTLAGSFLRGNHFGTQIQPLLNRSAAQANLTVSLAIVDDTAAVYVAQSTLHDSDVSFGFTVGSRLPLLHTAIGRVMLAFGDRAWARHRLEDASFEPYTAKTIVDRTGIGEQISLCRERGYAIVDGEFEHGVSGFAVPVGRVDLKAVVGTSMTSAQVRGKAKRNNIIEALRQVAGQLADTAAFS